VVVLDTSVIIDRIRKREEILENITVVTFVEYPKIVLYKKFNGNVIFPTEEDYILAHRIQLKLVKVGKTKPFADVLLASICINRDEELITRDRDFLDIAEVSDLKVKLVQKNLDKKL